MIEQEIQEWLDGESWVETWEGVDVAEDLLQRAKNMIEDLKNAFNCEGCRGPNPLCHITGELVCNRKPYYKGEENER